MKNIRRILSLFLVLVFSVTLGACSKVEEGDTATSNTVSESTETAENAGEEATEEASGEEAGTEEAVDASNLNDGVKANFEPVAEGEDFHIGIVTGTVSQSEDNLRGAEAAMEKYGDASQGGMIVHDTYPDRFEAELETTISKITAMADDPLMKAVIVDESVPGTVAAFQQIREKRPDIILVCATPQEDVLMVSEASDLVIELDNISRGYRIVKAAKDMGATKFVHVTFPRHMSIELLARRRAIMEEACKDLGLEFISLNAPDPTTDIGIPGAQQYIAENIGPWIEKYGKDTAFYCTNNAHTEPLVRGIAQNGAIFVEPDIPSPIMGYPNAFSVPLDDIAGDWPAILSRVEEAVVENGGSERMGTWAYSVGYSEILAATDHLVDVLEGKADLLDTESLKAKLDGETPGSKWMVSKLIDSASGKELNNFVLVAQDTYVFGKGYLGMDKEEVPEKYLNLKVNLEDILKEQENAEGDAE